MNLSSYYHVFLPPKAQINPRGLGERPSPNETSNAPSRPLCASTGFSVFGFAILGLLLILWKSGFAQTDVRGEVSGTWTIEGSPYRVFEGANVPEGQTLTINPGVEVLLDYYLYVRGFIIAEGTEQDSIFIRYNDEEGDNPFTLLYFFSCPEGERRLRYVKLVNLNNTNNVLSGIRVRFSDNMDIQFEHSTFISTKCLYIDNCGDLTINRCAFFPDRDRLHDQINVINAGPMDNVNIIENEFHTPQILLEGADDINIINNRFFYRDGIGISGADDIVISGNISTEVPEEDRMRIGEVLESGVNIKPLNDPQRDPSFCGRILFEDNISTGTWVFTRSEELIARNNSLSSGSLSATDVLDVLISDCQVSGSCGISVRWDEVRSGIVENCHVRNLGSEGDCAPIFRNNIVDSYSSFGSGTRSEVYNNVYCGGLIMNEGAAPVIHHNKIHGAINFRRGSAGEFYNNTVIVTANGDEDAIRVERDATPYIANNIFYHRYDISMDAGTLDNGANPVIRNNVFWGFELPLEEIDESNLIIDPLLANVGANDYRLQAHSPCIDAGDPDLPNDPDDTRSDIGAFYFNQNVNNPPAITSPVNLLIDYQSRLNYTVTATDDSEELSFSFGGLPDWFDVLDRDFASDTIHLSGIVPEGQPSFVLEVYCEDDGGAADTLAVNVEVTEAELLWGSLSGTLTREGSPYRIVESVSIDEGDSLIVEPGCVIYMGAVQWQPRPTPRTDVFGYLKCVGTEQDSIYLIGKPFHLGFYESRDTSEVGFLRQDTNSFGSATLNGGNLIYHDCNNKFGLGYSSGPGYLYAYNNIVFERDGYSATKLVLINNYFDSEISPGIRGTGYSGLTAIGDSVYSIDNIFRGFIYAGIFGESGYVVSKGDVFVNCEFGFDLDWDTDSAEVHIDRCFLSSPVEGPLFLLGSHSRLTVTNSIILNIDEPLLATENENYAIALSGNAFFRKDSLAEVLVGDGFGSLTDVNVNGDSTDAFNNLFGDPHIIDVYPYNFHLSRNSFCVDAGPDGDRDPDGSRPDIGPLPFDHDNRPVEITDSFLRPALEVIEGTEISCGVEIVDEDQDSIAFQWDLFKVFQLGEDSTFIRHDSLLARTPSVSFIIDSLGYYQTGHFIVRCLATDGYDVDTISFELDVTPEPELAEKDSQIQPSSIQLYPNYPNPFNSQTRIRFALPQTSQVRIALYDVLGRLRAVLLEDRLISGQYSISFYAGNLSSGIYFVRLETAGGVRTQEIHLIK